MKGNYLAINKKMTQARLKALLISLCSVLASVVGAFAGSHDAGSASISFRLAYASDTPDTAKMSLYSPKEVVYVCKTSILEGRDLLNARVESGPLVPLLIVTVTPAGAKRLKEATSSHLGAKLAVLVNGVLISAPTIRQVIDGNEMTINSSRLSSSEIENLAKTINKGS